MYTPEIVIYIYYITYRVKVCNVKLYRHSIAMQLTTIIIIKQLVSCRPHDDIVHRLQI